MSKMEQKPDFALIFRHSTESIVNELSTEKFNDSCMLRELHIPPHVMRHVVYELGKLFGWFDPHNIAKMVEIFEVMSVNEIMEEIRRADDVFYKI